MVGPELNKKDILMEARMEQSFPNTVNTNLDLLKQVFLNIVTALTHGASNTHVILTASGFSTGAGIEAVLDITCERTGLSPDEAE